MKRFSALYMGAAALLGGAFFLLLRRPLMQSTLELDLAWMLPAMSCLVEGRSIAQIAAFILAPFPAALEPPVLKVFLFPATPLIGLTIPHLVWMALLVHCANGMLLHRVLRQMGLGFRSAFLSACFYFSAFVHFHAILWPTAFQHLFAVFSILLLLHFYFKTEDKITAGAAGWRGAYAATLAAAALASLQRSGLIGHLLLLADILICSPGAAARTARFRRWFWLFGFSLLYPVWILASGVDGILAGMVLHTGLPGPVQDLFLPPGATASPVTSTLKYPGLLILGFAALIGAGAALRWAAGRKGSREVLAWMVKGIAAAGFVALFVSDKRQLLFPYNLIGLFVTVTASFFQPIQTALQLGVPEPTHYYIPPQIGLLSLGVSVGALAL